MGLRIRNVHCRKTPIKRILSKVLPIDAKLQLYDDENCPEDEGRETTKDQRFKKVNAQNGKKERTKWNGILKEVED